MSAHRHIFLIAGEPSGDRLGASLMAGLHEIAPDVRFSGVGGANMEAEGLTSLFAMEDLSVMGLAEVLARLPLLLRRVRQTAEAVTKAAPDALVTIDSPDFCLRVADRARKSLPELKTIHYVAPTVWAWRPERAEKMARSVDHVLALFPFEPPYMCDAGMSCDFVGHPVAAAPEPDAQACADFRISLGIGADQPLLVALPGSRASEVARMAPVFEATLGALSQHLPDLAVVVAAAGPVAARLEGMLKDWPCTPILLDPRTVSAPEAEARKRLAFGSADIALAASGTVSLELAACGTPMLIAHKFNWLTTRMIKRKVALKTATLVNILTDEMAVPEFLFEACTPENITPAALELLRNPEASRAQIDAGRRAMDMLGRGGLAPGLRAARSVLDVISARK